MEVDVDRHVELFLFLEAAAQLPAQLLAARLPRLERVAAHGDNRRRDRADRRARTLDLRASARSSETRSGNALRRVAGATREVGGRNPCANVDSKRRRADMAIN